MESLTALHVYARSPSTRSVGSNEDVGLDRPNRNIATYKMRISYLCIKVRVSYVCCLQLIIESASLLMLFFRNCQGLRNAHVAAYPTF